MTSLFRVNKTKCNISFKIIDFKPLAPHHCGFESCQGFWILPPASLWNIGGSTWLLAHA